jgi:hypothetical protein
VVGDAYYSKRERPARCRLVSKKKSFVDGVTRAGKAFVCKLRVDANLKYKYSGPRTGKPGRPKKFDGKVERPKPVRCCCGVKKQFAGLMDSQSRSERVLEFAWNASF